MSSETSTPIASRADFHDALRAALAQAAATGAAEICLVDPHFDEWPLNERDVVASLEQWASSRRRLNVIAHSFDELARRASRFVGWRRSWSHIVQCRTVDEIEADQVPTLLFIPGLVSVRLLDRVRYRGVVSGHATDLVECRETIDALLQRSTEGFPATTLGL